MQCKRFTIPSSLIMQSFDVLPSVSGTCPSDCTPAIFRMFVAVGLHPITGFLDDIFTFNLAVDHINSALTTMSSLKNEVFKSKMCLICHI